MYIILVPAYLTASAGIKCTAKIENTPLFTGFGREMFPSSGRSLARPTVPCDYRFYFVFTPTLSDDKPDFPLNNNYLASGIFILVDRKTI